MQTLANKRDWHHGLALSLDSLHNATHTNVSTWEECAEVTVIDWQDKSVA